MRRGFEALNESKELERRAAAAETNDAISSDDPDAIKKLREKLEQVENHRTRAKDINAILRAAQRRAAKENVSWEPIAIAALRDFKVSEAMAKELTTPDFVGRIGVDLTNVGAEARRLEKRISELEAKKAKPVASPEMHGQIRIEEADNRVRIHFPSKPVETIRTLLRSYGFRFSPTESAWQRMASNAAWFHAREIAKAAQK